MQDQASSRVNTRGRSPLLAAILGLMAPGLGQLYNGMGRRAAAVVLSEIAFSVLFVCGGGVWVQWGYPGFWAFMALGWMLFIFVILEAGRTAWRGGPLPVKRYNRPFVYCAYVLTMWLAVPRLVLLIGTPTLPLWPARAYHIPSESMRPTLQVGDRIVVEQHAYGQTPPRPMDIIVFRRAEEGVTLVARVVAVGGDTVEVSEGKLTVNGRPVNPPWEEPAFASYEPFEVPEGTVFVMGDNVNNARDSRYAGPVSTKDVSGKVRFIWAGPGAGTEFP